MGAKMKTLMDYILEEYIVSKTDKKSRITYVNDKFCQISQYSREELLNKPHNIIRHPDMPKEVFKELWDRLKSGKTWSGIIKNKAKDGSPYWVSTFIFPDPEGEGYMSIRQDITHFMSNVEQLEHAEVLYKILQASFTESDLIKFLEKTLDYLLEIPWLALLKKGGFFLDKGNQTLELVVHKNVGNSIPILCKNISYGQCLCGTAALRKEIIFKSCVDEDHHNRPEGMQPHGHYNIPFVINEAVLGVLFLFVPHGHQQRERELKILKQVQNVITSVLYRKKLEEYQQQLLEEIKRANQIAIEQLKQIEQLQNLIQTYTPRLIWEVAPKALNDRLKELPPQKVKQVFLFCDMKDFTKYSETHDPEDVIETINSFFSFAVQEVYRNDGDIERFMGDAFFAVFDVPYKAIYAAALINQHFKNVNQERERRGQETILFRMGMHIGEVVRGNVGGLRRKEYTVIGDAVNIAARLESNCKPGKILISEALYRELGDEVLEVSPFYEIKVKGKEQKIRVCYVRKVIKKSEILVSNR